MTLHRRCGALSSWVSLWVAAIAGKVAVAFKGARAFFLELGSPLGGDSRAARAPGYVRRPHGTRPLTAYWLRLRECCLVRVCGCTGGIHISETSNAAGCSTEHEEVRSTGLKVGILCGEEFRDNGQPSQDTRVQRSWLYTHDASLKNIHFGGTRPAVGKKDNELSVPIGEGAMAKVRADLKERQGRLFRTATQITKGRDKRPGIAIFKDDP